MTTGCPPGASKETSQRVLLLGPDDAERRALHLLLDRCGAQVAAASDVATARRHTSAEDCDVVLATAELAPQLRGVATAPVIAIVRVRDLGASLALLAAGVTDILVGPVDELAVTLALRRTAAHPKVIAAAGDGRATPELVGDGAAMTKLKAIIQTVAPARTTVMITGESGTGKELVARALHDASPRRAQRFVAINCAAIPEALVESELFGHVRGAFTDAIRDKPGLFEAASGGTLFIDEVGELPIALQGKLLRALQESEIRRVGAAEPIHIDVRVVAATLRDLAAEVAAGAFREDLYYRLNVVPIHVPALRERPEDVPALARCFAARHAARLGREAELPEAALDGLARQPWPGNVRELENLVERALVLAADAAIDEAFLSSLLPGWVSEGEGEAAAPAALEPDGDLSIKKATRILEADLIRRALDATDGNRADAAKLLDISPRSLLYKLKEYGIS